MVDVVGIRRVAGARTAMYNAVLDGSGDLVAAVSDMNILDEELSLHIQSCAEHEQLSSSSSDLIVVDGNLTEDAMLTLISSVPEDVSIWYEPTSVVKSNRCLAMLHRIELMSPNFDELLSIASAMGVLEEEEEEELEEEEWSNGTCTVERVKKVSEAVVSGMIAAASSRGASSRWLVVTMGKQGVVLCHGVAGEEEDGSGNHGVTLTTTHLRPETIHEEMVSCTGAGDCLLATVAAASMRGVDMVDAVRIGMFAASLTILDNVAVSPLLTRDWLESKVARCK
jgi:sugar/nucleoside kinase (ribokinase family)